VKGARQDSRNREFRGQMYFDIANPETPMKGYDCGHIEGGRVDQKV
jgi:hypothetical protein